MHAITAQSAGRHRAAAGRRAAGVVEDAVDDFMEALWEAIAIVLGVSFLSLGLRAGAVVACSIPLVLAAVFVVMEIYGHRPAARIARRAHHRARTARR